MGCMAYGACGPLVTYLDRMNGPAYIKIIEDALPLFIDDSFDTTNPNCVSMHDNAPHIDRITQLIRWFKS